MQCLDRFKKKMNYSGGSLRNENINNSQKLLAETFADDPSFTFGVYFWRLGLKEYEHEHPIDIRLYSRKYSAANGVTVKFQTLYNTPVIVGDIVYDTKNDEYLLCTEAFDIDGIHYQGKFTLCNWILKWQNKDGRILEYPCYDINATQYNSGEQPSKVMTIGTSQHMIMLPSDENTTVLSTPQRFYLDKNKDNPTTFIVTQNDTTSYNYGKKGIVRLTLFEHPNNPDTDRLDLGICDYIDLDKGKIKVDNVPFTISNTYKSKIDYSTTVIKSGGDSQVFVGKFYDEKGNEISNLSPHWTIICDFSDKLLIEEFDNCISIGIDDDSYIDEEFKLICSVDDKDIESSPYALLIKIESLL